MHLEKIGKRIKRFIRKRWPKNQKKIIIKQNLDLEWAHVYHDSIRSKEWLNSLSLNIGRWAGNYAFFYVLNRILDTYRPERIIELGLGESSKFISTYLSNTLPNSRHDIIEQSQDWKDAFLNQFTLCSRSQIHIKPLKNKEVFGYSYYGYDQISDFSKNSYDLYVVDGPYGSSNFSRYDIVNLMSNIKDGEEFIIIMDDANREGEKETIRELKKLFMNKGINTFSGEYEGIKSVVIIATEKYKYIQSL